MPFRAKFKCYSVTEDFAMFGPVKSGGAENDAFNKRVPRGNLKLGGLSKFDLLNFVEGEEYYVDLTLAKIEEE